MGNPSLPILKITPGFSVNVLRRVLLQIFFKAP